MSRRPLEGIRVLACSQFLAGPWGTEMLAAMGAQVIKVESTQVHPTSGRATFARPTKEMEARQPQGESRYPHRNPGPRPWNRNTAINLMFRNKHSMTVDLRTPEGKDIFKRLVGMSDVLVENFPVGTLARSGLDYAALKSVNPRLVYVSCTGFGQTGP